MLITEFLRRAQEDATAAKAAGAPIVVSIAVAQAALESAYGKSRLCRDANNLFGVKAGARWKGPTLELPTLEWDGRRMVSVLVRWRKYGSWAECFADYGAIIGRLPWFNDAELAARKDDAIGFLDGLIAAPEKGEPGWATDPRYREKVLSVARVWNLVPDV